MDLSTLTKLTREQLDTFAKRAGITNPERSTAAELVGALLNQRVESAERALRRNKSNAASQVAHGVLAALSQSGLLKRFARTEALPSTQPWQRTQPRPATQPTPPTPAATPTPEPIVAATPEPIVAATPEPVHAEPVQVQTAPAEPAPAEVAPPTPAQPAPPATPAILDDGVPTRRFVEEPIRTRSMARVLLTQGHRDRALSILESIVRDDPNDLAARDDLERLRADVPLDAQLSRLPEPTALPTLPTTGDSVTLQPLEGRALHLAWATTASGIARAQAVLGAAGELALRVVAITPDPTRVVRSEITERGPVEPQGDWTSPAVEPGARCFAAIGVRSGGRFVAIAHAPARTIV